MNVYSLCLITVSMGILYVLMLVKVEGQPTTSDDDADKNNLMDMVKTLQEEVAKLKAMISTTPPDRGTDTANDECGGATYTRWGRKTCEGNATLVYQGYAAGPIYNGGGGGSNFLCLPQDPDWDNFKNGSSHIGYIAGIEYELFDGNNVFSTSNTGGIPLFNNPAPCAVCYLDHRQTVLMVPAKTRCPDSWNREYGGYLASEVSQRYSIDNSRKRSSYVCWDRAPEVAVGGTHKNQAVIYPVQAVCGSLPCSTYISGRELTCVVCSK